MLKGQKVKVKKSKCCSFCGFEADGYSDDDDSKHCKKCGRVFETLSFDNEKNFVDSKNGKVVDGQVYNLVHKESNKYAEDCIEDIIRGLKLKQQYPEYYDRIGKTPLRIMNFAYKAFFLDHGSKIKLYAAAAVYIALRFQKAPFLLMDFSQKLEENLFKLAKCYRKLAKFLNVTLKLNEKLPPIDPSIYIPRFCKMLPFGDKVGNVRDTAHKVLTSMKKDWMAHGRRPSSLCGAAIIIAAKMHGIKITTKEICEVVSICEETLRKRLAEFKDTDVAQLTNQQFMSLDDVESFGRQLDPPSYTKNNNQKTQNKLAQLELKADNQMHQNNILKGLPFAQPDIGNNNQQNGNFIKPKIQAKQSDQNSEKSEAGDDEIDNTATEIENEIIQIGNTQTSQTNSTNCLVPASTFEIVLKQDEELSELDDNESKSYIMSEQEYQVKKILWYNQNKEWISQQSRKLPNLEKKDVVKRTKTRIPQLMNEQDPVIALLKSKKRDKLDENKLRELFDDIKSYKIEDIIEGNGPEKGNHLLHLDNQQYEIEDKKRKLQMKLQEESQQRIKMIKQDNVDAEGFEFADSD